MEGSVPGLESVQRRLSFLFQSSVGPFRRLLPGQAVTVSGVRALGSWASLALALSSGVTG